MIALVSSGIKSRLPRSASDPSLASDAHLARAITRATPDEAPAAEAELCRRFVPRVRFYGRKHLADPGQTVRCTAAPSDDFVALHLALSALDVGAVDAVDVAVEWTNADTGTREVHVVEGVSFDRTRGEIVFLHSGERIRSLPKSDWQMQAILHGKAGDTRVGPYTLNHTPWEQLSHS